MPIPAGHIYDPSFKMKVNDQVISVTGKKVKVGAAIQSQSNDPFRSFFDRDPTADIFAAVQTEFVDVKEDALLALTTNKDECSWRRFTTTLSFW